MPDDAMAVAQVHVRSWQAGYRGLLPDEYLDSLRGEERAQRYTFHLAGDDDPATTVAINQANKICGFVTSGPSSDGTHQATGQIYALCVDPDSWGQGIGRALIGAARLRLANIGFTEAVLWVLDGNDRADRADRFYRRDGWKPDDQKRHEVVWGVPVEAHRYQAALIDSPPDVAAIHSS